MMGQRAGGGGVRCHTASIDAMDDGENITPRSASRAVSDRVLRSLITGPTEQAFDLLSFVTLGAFVSAICRQDPLQQRPEIVLPSDLRCRAGSRLDVFRAHRRHAGAKPAH
jgi:hypothetical protein